MALKIQKIHIHMYFNDGSDEAYTLEEVMSCIREPQVSEEMPAENYTTSKATGFETWSISGLLVQD